MRFTEALAALDEAIRLDPGDDGASSWRGNTLLGMNEFARAEADYDEAIRLSPASSVHFANRRSYWNHQGREAVAVADLTEALRLDPSNRIARHQRGLALYRLGRYAEAEARADLDAWYESSPTMLRLSSTEPWPARSWATWTRRWKRSTT